MLDIGQHIIARCRYGAPRTYADTFLILVEKGFLPEGKKETYAKVLRTSGALSEPVNKVL